MTELYVVWRLDFDGWKNEFSKPVILRQMCTLGVGEPWMTVSKPVYAEHSRSCLFALASASNSQILRDKQGKRTHFICHIIISWIQWLVLIRANKSSSPGRNQICFWLVNERHWGSTTSWELMVVLMRLHPPMFQRRCCCETQITSLQMQ